MTTPLTSAFANVNFGLILSHMLQAIGDAILDFFNTIVSHGMSKTIYDAGPVTTL